MIKPYHSRNDSAQTPVAIGSEPNKACRTLIVPVVNSVDKDALPSIPIPRQSALLPNLEMLKVLPEVLQHLQLAQPQDVITIIEQFPCLFSDVLTCTIVIEHDINVKGTLLGSTCTG